MMRTRALVVAAVATTALALTACGSDSLSEGEHHQRPRDVGERARPSTRPSSAKLPAKIKDAGTIVIGTDATYQPNEYLDADGKTVIGMDVELFDAVMAKFGVKTEWVPSAFDAIILGVQSGKYDVGVSSFTVNAERMEQATMVSYFKAGTQWVTQKGNPKGIDPDDACGKTVGVQKGTVQADEDLPTRQQGVHRRRQARDQGARRRRPGQGHRERAVRQGRRHARRPPAGHRRGRLHRRHPRAARRAVRLGPLRLRAHEGRRPTSARPSSRRSRQLKADGTYDQILTKWKTEGGAHQRLRREPDGQLTP